MSVHETPPLSHRMKSPNQGQNPLPLLEPNRLQHGSRTPDPEEVVTLLRPYLTDARAARIEAVLAARTYAIAPVVEGLTNAGNVSAVVRSTEALGFQPFHIITGDSRYRNSSRTSQGAEKWLDIYRWETAAECVSHLRASGYIIAVTGLDATRTIWELEFGREKIALVFGNEKEGTSAAMRDAADTEFVVPMFGFGQSYNISVAAGICLFQARRQYDDRHAGAGVDLSPEERAVLRADFYLRSVKQSDSILERSLR